MKGSPLAACAAVTSFLLVTTAAAGIPLSTYQMSSVSMRPTLDDGDIVGADTVKGLCGLNHPHPGDVVIHRHGPQAIPYVARIVAGPGQTVELRRGRLWIDGRPVRAVPMGNGGDAGFGRSGQIVRETLPNGVSYSTLDIGPNEMLDNTPRWRVPSDAWFVLGDNRDNAADSRVAKEDGGAGFVSTKDICGVVNVVITAKDKSHVGRKP